MNYALSILIAVQPGVFSRILRRNEGQIRDIGLCARFLMTCPESTQGQRFYAEPSDTLSSVDAFNQVVRRMLELQEDCIEGGRLKIRAVSLGAEAKAVWVKYYDRIESNQSLGGTFQFLRDVASKSAENALRLAGLFHLIDALSGLDENAALSDWERIYADIGARHMQMAVEVAEYYLLDSLRYISEVALPDEIGCAKAMSDRLAAYYYQRKHSQEPLQDKLRPNEITLRDIKRKIATPAARKLPSLNPVLDELTEACHFLGEPKDAGNRRLIFTINPLLIEGDYHE